MKTIKVAHSSDLHYSSGNLKEADTCFEAAVTAAIADGVECAVVTGDTTDHAMDAHSPAVRALAQQLKRLSNHCPVLLLQGTFSHEPPGFLRLLALAAGQHGIAVADGISQWGLSKDGFTRLREDNLATYRMVVSALPTINKAHVAMLEVEGTSGDACVSARAAIAQVLRSWARTNEACRSLGIPTMVLSHGTVFDSVSESGVPMAGTDHELSVDSLFAAQADVVALGHIHKHQVWRDGQMVIAYAGSIGRFHHGEQGEKGWVRYDIKTDLPGGNEVDLAFVPTPSRRNIDFVFEGPPDLDEIAARLGESDGAFVRIRYTIDEEHRHTVDRAAIRNILENAADVQIEGRTCMVQRQRAQGISTVSMAQKLELWANATGTPDAQALQERLAMIEANPADVVAEQVVAVL